MSCSLCDGTGKYKKPNDPEEYDKIFDKYDSMGVFNMDQVHQKALNEVGYTIIDCPECNAKK